MKREAAGIHSVRSVTIEEATTTEELAEALREMIGEEHVYGGAPVVDVVNRIIDKLDDI